MLGKDCLGFDSESLDDLDELFEGDDDGASDFTILERKEAVSCGDTAYVLAVIEQPGDDDDEGTTFIKITRAGSEKFISCILDTSDAGVIVDRIKDLLQQGRYATLVDLFADAGTVRSPMALRLKLEGLNAQNHAPSQEAEF